MSLVKESRDSGGQMSMSLVRKNSPTSTVVTTFVGDFASAGFDTSIKGLFANLGLKNDLDRMSEVAFAKAMAKVNQTPLCTGEFLNDLGKSVEMLKRPFEGATKLLQKIAQGKSKHLKKSGSNAALAFSNAWLESTYGWKPVFMDVGNVVESTIEFDARNWKGAMVARAAEKQMYDKTLDFDFGQH